MNFSLRYSSISAQSPGNSSALIFQQRPSILILIHFHLFSFVAARTILFVARSNSLEENLTEKCICQKKTRWRRLINRLVSLQMAFHLFISGQKLFQNNWNKIIKCNHFNAPRQIEFKSQLIILDKSPCPIQSEFNWPSTANFILSEIIARHQCVDRISIALINFRLASISIFRRCCTRFRSIRTILEKKVLHSINLGVRMIFINCNRTNASHVHNDNCYFLRNGWCLNISYRNDRHGAAMPQTNSNRRVDYMVEWCDAVVARRLPSLSKAQCTGSVSSFTHTILMHACTDSSNKPMGRCSIVTQSPKAMRRTQNEEEKKRRNDCALETITLSSFRNGYMFDVWQSEKYGATRSRQNTKTL